MAVIETDGPRLIGIAFGSVSTAMVRHAPCSVLVARSPAGGEFPGLIGQRTNHPAQEDDAVTSSP